MNHSNLFIFNSEKRDVVKLTVRLAWFGLPFLLAALFILIIDPFDFFEAAGVIPDEIKRPIAMQLNPPLWKLNRFEKDPKEFILLGDSRMAPLETEVIKEVSGEDYANLGYGGASVREIIETFWIIVKKTPPKKVFIGVNLEKYNDYEVTNRVSSYAAIHENPAIYFVDHGVWEAAYYNIRGYWGKAKFTLGTPNMTREEFWQEDLKTWGLYYKKYAEPKKYRQDLLEISKYCRKNGIELKFIIFPAHIDAQKLITDAGFQTQNEALHRDLTACGDVYDFNWANDLTENENNFLDPVHVNQETRRVIITEVWKNDLKYGKLLFYAPQ